MAEERDGGYGIRDRDGRFRSGNTMLEKVLDCPEVGCLVLYKWQRRGWE